MNHVERFRAVMNFQPVDRLEDYRIFSPAAEEALRDLESESRTALPPWLSRSA